MHEFQRIFESAPDAYLLLRADADFTIAGATDIYLRVTMTTREQIVGRPLFEVFPEIPATSPPFHLRSLRESLLAAIATKQPQELPPFRYDIPRPSRPAAELERRHWRVSNTPVLDASGRVTHLINRIEDVTAWLDLQEHDRAQHSANESLRSRVAAATRDLALRSDELEHAHRELTQQRQALQEARTRLEAAIFSGYIATWIWELSNNRIHGDAGLAHWFRIAPDEPAPTSFDEYLERIHPEDAPLVRERVEASLAGGEGGEVEYRIVRGENPRRVLARWRVERDATRHPTRLTGVLLDISELRAATEIVAQLREQLRLAAEAAEIGTFSWTLPFGELVWSERLKEQFFLPPDSAVEISTFYARIHPADRTRVRSAIKQAIAHGARYDIEFRVTSTDGHLRWIHASGRAYRDASGTPSQFNGISLDVTRQKQIEAELLESEARYRLVVDSLPDYAIFLLDDHGLVTHWNAGAERLLGYSADEILGRSARILFTPEDRARGEDANELETAKRTGRASDDRWHIKKDGTRFFVTGLMTTLTDALGHRIGLAKIMRDVTDRHAAAAERERLLENERAARAEAERTSRLKDDFLATLSHELRTPLNAILGWTQVLKEGPISPEELAEGLEIIDRNTRVQAQLIEDLLDTSRIVSGKVRLVVQRIDFAPVVSAAIDSVRTTASAKQIRLLPHFTPGVLDVMGDRTRLQQVVWNLLFNAIKFTPQHGRVDVFLDREHDRVILRVRDTGAGIDPNFIPHLFQRFSQADASTTRQHGGLGLGLSIVKQLVELHGGQVHAESAGLGHGATFSVTLPLLASLPPSLLPPRPPPASLNATPVPNHADLTGLTVLVVEDEPDSASLVQRILRSHGAEVHVSSNVTDGVARFQQVRPHVIVSDIGMPQLDGYELMRRIRALPHGAAVPAAALSALAREQDIQRSLDAGFQQHLAKPVEPALLVSTIAHLAGR
jgi:PAS domain S-box